LIGTATDHDVIDAIRRAKDARSPLGGQERSDLGIESDSAIELS
jgi:hypothetical protein